VQSTLTQEAIDLTGSAVHAIGLGAGILGVFRAP
jgi:hypothetical protein